MKIFKYLMDNYINPVIASIIVSIIIALGSKAYTGKWLEWFKLIPLTTLKIVGGWILLWIVIIFISRRFKNLKNSNGIFAAVNYGAPYGWVPLGEIEYNEVIWRFRSPKSTPYGDYSKSDIDVETPPRCPNCETELEQSNSFWGGYIWKCLVCDFKKRNRESYYTEEERVKKIARRNLELQDDKT